MTAFFPSHFSFNRPRAAPSRCSRRAGARHRHSRGQGAEQVRGGHGTTQPPPSPPVRDKRAAPRRTQPLLPAPAPRREALRLRAHTDPLSPHTHPQLPQPPAPSPAAPCPPLSSPHLTSPRRRWGSSEQGNAGRAAPGSAEGREGKGKAKGGREEPGPPTAAAGAQVAGARRGWGGHGRAVRGE